MQGFPSQAWVVMAIELLNADPDAPAAAEGWDGDFGVVIDLPEGSPLAVYLGPPRDGRLPAPEFPPLEALEVRTPRYYARASADDWLALMSRTLDPIAAIVQKRLVARGDLGPVVARLHYRGLAQRWLERLRQGA
jgi:hypothetical protein